MSDTPKINPWPTRADGSPMTVGEMTPEQRRDAFKRAAAKLQREFSTPEMQAALAKVLA